MSFSKATLQAAGLILGTICLHGCGPDPRMRFMTEVEGMIRLANEGKHTELVDRISKPLQEKIRQEGWDDRGVLAFAARRDREDGAQYQLMDVPRFEAQVYGEAEIRRTSPNRESRMVIPCWYEEKKWKAGAGYRDGRSWEYEDF